MRISSKETLIRSLEAGKLVVHRKLPRSESLKDCMDRTIPYWTDTIVTDAIDAGKNVLIASSENAIRGLLMHLFNIPVANPNPNPNPNLNPNPNPNLYSCTSSTARWLGP